MKPCVCACGKPKAEDQVVCRPCWQASPLDLRQTYTTVIDRTYKREVARQLIALARDRKPAVEAKPRQMIFVL